MPDTQKPSQPVDQTQSQEAFVSVGGSIPDPNFGQSQDEDNLTTFFRMRNRYILDERILPAPICAKPNSQEITLEYARVSLPTAALAVDWQCWRKGARPQQPKSFIESANDVVVHRQELDYENVELEGDDQLYIASAGTYFYSFQKRKQSTLSFPVPPYSSLSGADINFVVVQPGDFVPGVIDAAWPNPAAHAEVSKR